MCNSARSHALAHTEWNISQLTGSWIAYCGNDRFKLMDPHRNMSITSHCSQLWLLDEWLQVVYGIWWRLFLPIIERERRRNVSCAAGIRMRRDKGLWGLDAMREARRVKRHGSHVPEPEKLRRNARPPSEPPKTICQLYKRGLFDVLFYKGFSSIRQKRVCCDRRPSKLGKSEPDRFRQLSNQYLVVCWLFQLLMIQAEPAHH